MSAAVTTAAAAFAAVALGFAVEAAGHDPRTADLQPAALATRAGLYAALSLLWFSLCWRPLLAGAAALITLAALRVVSEKKRRLVREPLAFSDFALLQQVVRYPDLYYVDARALLPIAVFLGLVGGWMWAEPTILPADALPAAAAVIALPAILVGVGRAAARPFATLADRLAEPFGPEADALARALTRGEARLGLLLSLLVGLGRWNVRRRAPPPRAAPDAMPPLDPPPRAVVVVQLESFIDPDAISGGFAAPNLARMRREALLQGALGVPGHGAYTMRSEFAVLSGLEPSEIGEEGYDPYLSIVGRGFATLATALRGRGHRTAFVHPFRRGFFGRDRVLPGLGFERLVMEEDFDGAERVGGYVSDAAVAERILAELDGASGPALVFAVTMQNHGPWRVELDPPAGTPLERYRRHLADGDRIIGTVLDGLEARKVSALLCVYGDHAPTLGALGPPAPGPVTPYAIVRVGTPGPGTGRDLSAAALGRILQALTGH